MREQRGGSIVNISSIAAVCSTGIVAYKASKAGVNAYTQSLAIGNAKYGIRANVIMPGLMNTPMAIEGISQRARRRQGGADPPARRPGAARRAMGTAWDVAYAALFLPPTRRASSPAWRCRSTAVRARASADYPFSSFSSASSERGGGGVPPTPSTSKESSARPSGVVRTESWWG